MPRHAILKMSVVLGIDPGATGALAFYSVDDLLVWDMPVHEITKGKSKRKRFDPYGFSHIINQIPDIKHAVIEQVSAQPGNGAAAAFTYGWMCGGLEACLACMEIPYTYVAPQKWKKQMACPKDKDGARMRASQLMPEHSHLWKLKKHDGRAEAALIAKYGKEFL